MLAHCQYSVQFPGRSPLKQPSTSTCIQGSAQPAPDALAPCAEHLLYAPPLSPADVELSPPSCTTCQYILQPGKHYSVMSTYMCVTPSKLLCLIQLICWRCFRCGEINWYIPKYIHTMYLLIIEIKLSNNPRRVWFFYYTMSCHFVNLESLRNHNVIRQKYSGII